MKRQRIAGLSCVLGRAFGAGGRISCAGSIGGGGQRTRPEHSKAACSALSRVEAQERFRREQHLDGRSHGATRIGIGLRCSHATSRACSRIERGTFGWTFRTKIAASGSIAGQACSARSKKGCPVMSRRRTQHLRLAQRSRSWSIGKSCGRCQSRQAVEPPEARLDRGVNETLPDASASVSTVDSRSGQSPRRSMSRLRAAASRLPIAGIARMRDRGLQSIRIGVAKGMPSVPAASVH